MTVEKSCGAVVFTRTDEGIKYVIIANEVGYYGFPKGHTEDGETETETAYREILEETGLRVTIIDGFRTTDSHPHVREGRPTIMKHMVYFLAEYSDQKLVPQEGEVTEITLMTYEEAMAKFQFESSKRILREADEFLRSYKGEQA
jgi:8-oxo-dGTP pyrophosphatase MutT (NUDIX family)